MSATATATAHRNQIIRRAGRSLAYCATLVPVALFTLATTPVGGADAAVARHQSLMWEVGDLMNQWESLSASQEPE